MKLRLARPKYLIDLNRIPGLSYIKEQDGWLLIGALTRHAEIEASPLVRERIPLMQQAVRLLGDCQVRNLGTLGGALVEADPAGDWGPVILALNGKVRCVGSGGGREVEAKDFFTFAYSTALEPDELVKEIAVPLPSNPRSAAYINKDGICRDIGIGLGGAHECPMKAVAVEAMLRGHRLSPELVARASEKIEEIASPIGDLRGTPEYKKEVLKVIFRRALEQVRDQSAQGS